MSDPALKVVPISEYKPDKEIMTALEILMSEVADGKVDGVVLIKFGINSTFAIKKAGEVSDLECIGAMTFAQHDIMVANKPK